MRSRGFAVLTVMLMQCCRDYPGLPDAMALDVWQIRTYYKYLVPELTRHGR